MKRRGTGLGGGSRRAAGGLFVVGLSHMLAPVRVRERLSVPAENISAALKDLQKSASLGEAVILSTCSRFEVYGTAEDSPEAAKRVTAWFKARGVSDIERYLYVHRGLEAAQHLFRVSAGLDSWIVGEGAVLGQVKTAYQTALELRHTSRALNILFQKAISAGKAVRAQTRLGEGINSVGGAAAMLARKIFGGTGARSVLLFGAGAMAKTAARHLIAKGATSIRVANRTYERAVELAESLGGSALSFEEGLSSLAQADIIVFSTSAQGYVADRGRLAEAAESRNGRSLFLIDIGVPRNVDPAAADLSGVYLYDIDDLKRMVERDLRSRKPEFEKAVRLVRESAEDCWTRIKLPAHPEAAVGNRRTAAGGERVRQLKKSQAGGE